MEWLRRKTSKILVCSRFCDSNFRVFSAPASDSFRAREFFPGRSLQASQINHQPLLFHRCRKCNPHLHPKMPWNNWNCFAKKSLAARSATNWLPPGHKPCLASVILRHGSASLERHLAETKIARVNRSLVGPENSSPTLSTKACSYSGKTFIFSTYSNAGPQEIETPAPKRQIAAVLSLNVSWKSSSPNLSAAWEPSQLRIYCRRARQSVACGGPFTAGKESK